jgi:quinol monooxygenase YgiN
VIHTVLTIAARTDQRDELLRALRVAAAPTCVESGCIRCMLLENVDERGTFTLMEEWLTQLDWERHIMSDRYSQVLQLIEASARPPVVRFNVIHRTLGMSAIRTVRGGRQLSVRDEADQETALSLNQIS